MYIYISFCLYDKTWYKGLRFVNDKIKQLHYNYVFHIAYCKLLRYRFYFIKLYRNYYNHHVMLLIFIRLQLINIGCKYQVFSIELYKRPQIKTYLIRSYHLGNFTSLFTMLLVNFIKHQDYVHVVALIVFSLG